MWRAALFEKTLILGKIEGRRGREWQRMRWLDGITDLMPSWVWVNSRCWWWTGRPGVLQFMGLVQRVRHDWATELNFIGRDLCWFFFPLMGKGEWWGNPVYSWLGLYLCFVCCLDEMSCTGSYWWLGDARSCIEVVSFVEFSLFDTRLG